MPAYTLTLEGAGSDTVTYEGIRYFADTSLKLVGTSVSRDGNVATAEYTNLVGSADMPLTLHTRIQHLKDANKRDLSRYSVRVRAPVTVVDTTSGEETLEWAEAVIAFNIPPVLRNTGLVQDVIQILYTALQNQAVQGTAGSATDRVVSGISSLIFGAPNCFG